MFSLIYLLHILSIINENSLYLSFELLIKWPFVVEQEQKPSYSVPLDDSICIKDMRWAKKDAKAYAILSSDGKLYHGSGQGPLTCVMEGVDSGMSFPFCVPFVV